MNKMLGVLQILTVSCLATGSVVSTAAAVDISNTGPGSRNIITTTNNNRVNIKCTNKIDVKNNNRQNSTSGNATVINNTSGGNAQSGNARNSNQTSVDLSATCAAAPSAAPIPVPGVVVTPPVGGVGVGAPSLPVGGAGAGEVTPPVGGAGAEEIVSLPVTGNTTMATTGIVAAALAALATASRLGIGAYSLAKKL